MDDFYRSQQSLRGEPQINAAFVSTPRNGPMLPRRFTTDSGRVPTLSTITTVQRGPEPQEIAPATLEKKRLEYERLREHKRRFEAEIHKLDAQQRQEERELQMMQQDLASGRFAGHQSEPTTPPEYRETSSGFPTMFSRPNRYSTSSLTSPPGIFNRPGRSGSQLTSPQAGLVQSRFAFDDQLPSRSVPGSRRNSDEDEKEEAVRQDPTSHRSTNALNRYSMPVTRSRPYITDIGLEDSNNTTGFLFGDEDSNSGETRTTPTAQANGTDAFPTLFRQQGYTANMLSTSSSALDLAQAQSSGQESTATNGWANMNKHRSQQSVSTIGSTQLNGGAVSSPSEVSGIGSRPNSMRLSMDGSMKFFQDGAPGASDATPPSVVSPPNHIVASPPKLQQSYSANDVTTLKTPNNSSSLGANANNHAQQHFHNHNASLGRIPAGAMPHRHSRELSNDAALANGRDNNGYPSITSTLHANAAPFGPPSVQTQSSAPSTPGMTSPASSLQYQQYYNGANYNGLANGLPPAYTSLPMLVQGMQGLSAGPSAPQPSSLYSPQNYTGYGPLYANNNTPSRPPQDSQARVIANRRQLDSEAMARFNGMTLEQVGGTIYTLCKDQHGCRYLQKQLENRIPEQIHMIWLETNQHVVELMTDPFGNYLCQKLLEYCGDDERTVLIQNAAPEMVRIALNQHGTRALQKMIEHVTTPVQINTIIEALRYQVVELIQDLNGNHVIQKCLNKLSPKDAHFIFEAVGHNCIDVGTHRHGCCVLQRCIDHANGTQKQWLIECITDHAVALVQDPFGNYVVQYIIDLNEESFTEPLVYQFKGRIAYLSKHKFSSNVVEKCLRCASDVAKDMIVQELLSPTDIERLLRDSFANYVVQTALEYATPSMKHHLVETIRPHLPSIRATPYGRRIQAKIQAYDARSNTQPPGQMVPVDASGGQISTRLNHPRTMSNASSILGAGTNGVNNNNNFAQAHSQVQVQAQAQIQAPPQPPRVQQFTPQFTSMGSSVENGETQWF
ncbi:armadillo-type protein [Lasiosphaeria miniovina]|uniref:Armadillo-type protein n=1 Tax=Lasiosphaeria miniovina TaxID=1954250 RepID=A0AA40DMN7_9PEZI|nr:armadillo-type protein [Lasiosphaeria miniovina]KAK0706462.1 armadillo-type protein [Lasiosphaeria miniovina]